MQLGVAVIAGAMAWGAASMVGVLAAFSFAAAIASPGNDAGNWKLVTAITTGALASGTILWRARYLASRYRVALWIEERLPRLHYSLITAIEPAFAATSSREHFSRLEEAVAREDIAAVTGAAVLRTMLPAVAAASIATALLYASALSAPDGQGLLRRLSDGAPRSTAAAGSKLEKLEVIVTPPGYTGARSKTLDNPSSVSALTGSRIFVKGAGTPESLRASLGTARLAVSAGRESWSLSLTMPQGAAALALRDRGYERLLILEPMSDAPPVIALLSPQRDSTLRQPRMVVRLSARATDDIGLNGAYFEYLVTSGSGEIFSARTLATPVVRFGGTKTGSISATLDLGSLKLGQGDVVSMRAVTHDRNSLSGPGIATSDTRTFRIARADEYAALSVDAAAPAPVDSSAMSQRMLIMMTEELIRKEKTLSRTEWVKQSTDLGDMEDRIRKRVDAILNASDSPEDQSHLEEAGHVHTLDENAGPLNKDLLEAYNALWEAVRSLQIAEPAPALPPMRVALKALDRARVANRLYLRGAPPAVIVDLARVRLSGKEKGAPSIRTARTAADTARARMVLRFNDAIEMLPRAAPGALRTLMLLRVDAIAVAPSFAAALGEAVEALRSGRDATLSLLRARRALEGEPSGVPGLSPWSGSGAGG